MRDNHTSDTRGVSEVYGAVLMVSFALLMALLIIGTGTVLLDQLGSSSEDTLAQDAMVTMDDRIADVLGSDIDDATTFSFPTGTGGDVTALPDEGRVIVTVETNESYQDLVVADESDQGASETLQLGTIQHVSETGVVTAYQGGGLWEQQQDDATGQYYTIPVTPQSFDYDGESIDFSFVDISSIESIQEGQELTVQYNRSAVETTSDNFRNFLDPYWNITGSEHLAPVDITVTIESEFAHGWYTYARTGMTEEPDHIDDDQLDAGTVTFEFHELGEATFPTDPTFSPPTVYSGPAEHTVPLWDRDHPDGEIEPWQDGFRIKPGPVRHTELALYDETHEEWLIWRNAAGNPSPNEAWINVRGDVVYGDATGPSPVQTIDPSNKRFEIEDGTGVCIIADQGANYGHPNHDSGGIIPYLSDCAAEHVPDGAPLPDTGSNFEIDIDESQSQTEIEDGGDLTLTVDVENTGAGNGTQDVGLYYFTQNDTQSGDPILVDYEADVGELDAWYGDETGDRIDLAWTDATWEGPGQEKFTLFVVGEDDFDSVDVTVERGERAEFEVTVEEGASDSLVSEGDRLDVEVTVENVGGASGSQFVYLEEPHNGNIADTEQVHLDAGEDTTVQLGWLTTSGDAIDEADAFVHSNDHSDGHEVTVEESERDDTPAFTVETLGDEPHVVDDELELAVAVENEGGDDATQDVGLFDFDGNLVDVTAVTLEEDEGEVITLTWDPDSEFAGETDTVTVASADDDDEATVDLTAAISQSPFFEVAIEDVEGAPVEEGKPVTVTATVENTGGVEGSQLLVLADFDGNLVDVVEVTDLEPGGTTTEAFVWEQPQDIDPANDAGTLTVSAEDTNDEETVDIASQLVVDEVESELQTNNGTTLAVTATVEHTGPGSIEQTVVLANFDGNEVDSQSVSVTGREEVDLTWDMDASDLRTDRITVSTADDEKEQQVVIERTGPVCDEVEESTRVDGSLLIETVDQLQCIDHAEPNHDTRGQSLGDDYRLADDIDATGTQYWNGGDGFTPIADSAHSGNAFEGDFDGAGRIIENLTIQRPDEDFVGLFATQHHFDGRQDPAGSGSTIENVRLEGVDIHGSSVVGGLIAGAGGTVKNASVSGTVRAEYQDVGGLIGHSHHAELDNQLVSRATVIGGPPGEHRHPWSSDNIGIGGIIGGTGYDSTLSIAYSQATVKGNSSVGGIIGWTSDNPSDYEQFYWADGTIEESWENEFSARPIAGRNRVEGQSEGALAGRMDNSGDVFAASTYWNVNANAQRPVGENAAGGNDDAIQGLTESQMKGPSVLPDEEAENYPGITTADTEGTMSELDWSIWEPVFDIEDGAVVNEDYPVFRWEVEAAGGVFPTIDDIDEVVQEGETIEVDVTVENTLPEEVTQNVVLVGPDQTPLDSKAVTLAQTVAPGSTDELTLEWETEPGDAGDALDVIVQTEDDADARTVNITTQSESNLQIAVTDTTSPVPAGGSLLVNATVENEGTGLGWQTVVLTNPDGNIVDSTDVQIGGGDDVDVTFEWQTTPADVVENGSVTVFTADDDASAPVTVEEATDDGAVFEVAAIEAHDPVQAGEDLDVEVTIENTGTVAGQQFVVLADGEEFPPIYDDRVVELAPGESETLTLTWATTLTDDGHPSVGVYTQNDNRTVETSVEAVDSPQFEVEVSDTNSPVELGDELEVTATVENVGDVAGDQFLSLQFEGAILDIQTLTLDAGAVEVVTFTWETTFPVHRDPIAVYSNDDSDTETVTVKPPETGAGDIGMDDPVDVNLELIEG